MREAGSETREVMERALAKRGQKLHGFPKIGRSLNSGGKSEVFVPLGPDSLNIDRAISRIHIVGQG
jgi:hypothetical protein